jgi:hypothetical protein
VKLSRLPALRVPASLNTCTICAQHYDAEVIVTQGRSSECGTLITNLTGAVGHATCTGFETAGWNANTQAGPLARFVATHQQATVAASADQEQQVTGAQQALETDLATLQRATSALTGSTSLTVAVNRMKHDYAQEQADYAREQHDSCPAAAGDATTAGQDSAAEGQGKTIITEAQALAATAQGLASQHGC